MKNIFEAIMLSDVTTVIFDIDGTLKDLCKEHSEALVKVINNYVKGKNKRKRLVIFFDRIAMGMVKSGMLPTNHSMQDILLTFYSIILNKDIKSLYYREYQKEIRLFDGVENLIKELSKSKLIYFATVNKQNYNIEECGISDNQIECTSGTFKIKLYKALIKNKKIDKKDVIIVGDNIFDDILSAKLLGVKFLLVDNYRSNIKKIFKKER